MTSPPAGDRLWAWGSSFAAKDEPASPVLLSFRVWVCLKEIAGPGTEGSPNGMEQTTKFVPGISRMQATRYEVRDHEALTPSGNAALSGGCGGASPPRNALGRAFAES